jgi:enoyl-CoA hydratase
MMRATAVAVDRELVHVADDGGVAIVTLDRPPANALDPSMLRAGLDVLDRLLDARPNAVVIAGANGFFCGGADLEIVPRLSAEDQAEMARDINRLFAGWYEFPRPVVAAVNGHAVAGGLILALCADHRVVGVAGRFGLTEIKVGIPYPSAAMAVVRAELAPPVARRLVLQGELFGSEVATALAVFDELVADDAVVERSVAVARQLADLPSATFETVKRQLRSDVMARRRESFGGAQAAGWVMAEAQEAARRVLHDRDGPPR